MRPIKASYVLIIVVGAMSSIIIVLISSLPTFTQPDITTLIFSAAALIIALANFFYNSWKEPDLVFSETYYIKSNMQKSTYFVRVRNKGRGKAEKCVGHLTIVQTEKVGEGLPPSNRTVWRFGAGDYVLDQDIGYQDDLLLFEKESSFIIFPSAYTGEERKKKENMGNRYARIRVPIEKAKSLNLHIQLEAKTGHMPNAEVKSVENVLKSQVAAEFVPDVEIQ